MPFLGGPYKNVNLGFYSTGFIKKNIEWEYQQLSH